jgi:Fe-S-cluster containining protein
MSEQECKRCGACCRSMIVELGCHDMVREPKLAGLATPFRSTTGGCGFIAGGIRDGDPNHEGACHWLAAGPGKPCPLLGSDNLCSIYPTRPNCCVAFPASGTRCRELRESKE